MTLRRTGNRYKSRRTEIEFIGTVHTVYLVLEGRLTNEMEELFENEGLMSYVYEGIKQTINHEPYLPNERRVKEYLLVDLMERLQNLITSNHVYAAPLAEVITCIGKWYISVSTEQTIPYE